MSSSSGNSLIERLLESETKAELLLLFRRNPGLVDEIGGIARLVGKRNAESIATELNDLVEIGVVHRRKVGKSDVFSLDLKRDTEVQAEVGNYLKGIKK